MIVTAHLNSLRIAPRKVRLVSGALKGLDSSAALHRLRHLPKRSARPLLKLLDSALANAYSNFGLVKENMYIKDIVVNEGAKLKRYRPKGFGSTSPLEKKTSHITVILEERVPGLKAETKPVQKESELEPASVVEIEEKTEKKKGFTDKTKDKKKGVLGGIRGLGRKFFRRKAI